VNQVESSSEEGPVNFFIVDCRPIEHFSSGHLPGSYSLDANLVSIDLCVHEYIVIRKLVQSLTFPSCCIHPMTSQWQLIVSALV